MEIVLPECVAFSQVEVVHESAWGLWCRVGGREIWVPRGQILSDGLRHAGDCGTLVIPRWYARDWHLL